MAADFADSPELADLMDLLDGLSESEVAALVDDLPPGTVAALLDSTGRTEANLPHDPLAQALELAEGFRERDHLVYLSERLRVAVADVEAGTSRFISVRMPPRSGKSTTASLYFPTWLLRSHPDWNVGVISHGSNFATTWGRGVRRLIENNGLGVSIAPDLGAASEWETTEGGGMIARGVSGDVTGRGFKVLLLDDLVKGIAEAHSETNRNSVWDKWRSDFFTRLEPPFLVVAIGTRWHQDDFLGRLDSAEYEGDPAVWEVIEFPALAEEDDVLGRHPGEPLLSPLLDETTEEALARWLDVKASVGTYAWNALYQQRPSPSKGAIFDTDWWRYWTHNEAKASHHEDGTLDPNGRVVFIPPSDLDRAQWLDSWDCAFKGTDQSDYVVGQRWAQIGVRRLLVAQHRARMTFTRTLATMKEWGDSARLYPPHTRHVHLRLVEDKANGTAIIDTLKEQIAGMVPVNPSESKEARARAVTPEVEAGNVFLPLPSDDGNEWVTDLLSELREFPTGAHDDQVDALTQALTRMRTTGKGSVTVPGRVTSLGGQRRTQAAQTSRRYGSGLSGR